MMSAVLSPDGRYRYRLGRDLGMWGAGACCFVMLNPSTADAERDDPTIRRCIRFARRFDCRRLEVVNLFAYRATDPRQLARIARDEAVGSDNDRHIAEACKASRLIIAAWGNLGALFGRADEVVTIVRARGGAPLMALGVNAQTGHPAHPLYQPAAARLVPFLSPAGASP